jgi:glutaredoxin
VVCRALLVASIFTSLAAGCTRAPTGGSPEHARALARYEQVMAQTLDPSYADPAFDEVESLLRAVPAEARERTAALALADEIAAGRTKQRALLTRLEAFEKAPPMAAAPTPDTPPEVDAPAAPSEAAPREVPASAPPTPEPPAPAPREAAVASAKPRPSGPVVMYTTAWCGVCKRAKAYLDRTRVAYVEKDVESSEAYAAEYQAKRAQHGLRSGVPLIDVDGLFMVGFGADGLQKMLEARGYL